MSTDQLVAQFLETNRVTRVRQGRRAFARRAISAIAEGPDFKLDQLRADQAAGRLDKFGRKIR